MSRGQGTQLLREIVRTHHVLAAGFSREVGTAASRFGLMREMALASGALGIMEIARRLGVNAAAVTRQVIELEREGLVVRRGDMNDRRRRTVELSTKGLRLFKDLHDRNLRLEHALASAMDAEEVAVTVRVLSTLRRLIDEMREPKQSE